MIKENKNIVKVYSLTNKRKKMLALLIRDTKEDIFNIEYLIKNTNFDINNIDICSLLNIDKFNEYIDCIFFPKQFAWISKGDNGKQRYFTKGYITYGLDVYDLLSIYFNCSYSQVQNNLAELGCLISKDKEKNITKINYNINNISSLIKENELEPLLLSKIDIYIALNDFCKKKSLAFNKYKNEEIFFISSSYLKEQYSLKYSISTINQVINLYSSIGLIYKVPESTINSRIYNAYKRNQKKSPINFYSLPNINDFKIDIVNNSKYLIDNKIKYYNLNKFNISNLQHLKSEIVYTNNNGGGDKTKKSKEMILEKNDFEILFNYYLETEGIVAKEWIKESKTITMKDTLFNKKWNEMIIIKEGKSIKPNKNLVNKYNLKSKQDIFIKNSI